MAKLVSAALKDIASASEIATATAKEMFMGEAHYFEETVTV